MMDTYNLSEIRSFPRARHILGAVTLLFALSLAGPPRLWGQCQQGIQSFTISPGSIIALAADPYGSASGTVTLNCPSWYQGTLVGISVSPANGALSCAPAVVPAGGTSGKFGCSAVQGSGSFTLTATLDGSTATTSLGVVPLTASVSVSPATIVGGSGQQPASVTITTNAPVRSIPPYIGQFYVTVQNNCNGVSGGVDAQIWPGKKQVTVSMGASAVTEPTQCSFILANDIWGGPTTSGAIMVRPATAPPGGAVNAADNGHPACIVGCGHPINITNGNVWIDQRDYSVPGLGGGLELSRVWNSQWFYSNPPALAGMFGLGWQSTYEEQLMLQNPQTLVYWRGDGSGWTFIYNSTLNSYSLSSPPNERAQLVSNPTGGFTLILADGTQKVFNNQDLLAAVIDRNNNQTTLAYDGSNRLTSVTSPGGSTLTFTYGDSNNPLQVTTVQDSVGVVATYTYDSSSRLTKVSYPDGSALNFTNDPNSSMILSVTDSQGKLLESHTYDAQGRGLTSSRAYGVDSVSLTY